MVLALVLGALLAMPVDGPMAQRGDASALIAAARHHRSVLQKLRALQLPGPGNAHIVRTRAPGDPTDPWIAATTIDNTIYDPKGSLRHDRPALGHEAFHVLDFTVMQDRDRRRLMRAAGMQPGSWDSGGQHSPDEVLADWYGALAARLDPRHSWEATYAERVPSRRQLLRFGRAVERMGHRYDLGRYVPPSY